MEINKVELKVYYLCDGKRCGKEYCNDCKHTSNPRHAIHVGTTLSLTNFDVEVVPLKNGNTSIFLIEKEEINEEGKETKN